MYGHYTSTLGEVITFLDSVNRSLSPEVWEFAGIEVME
jgi:hypothetical protein